MSSSYTKSKLKASRDALGKKNWQEASDAARDVLEQEANNYNANVFLGLALLNLEQYPQSEAAYRKAIEVQPDQLLAYQGLTKFYTQRKEWVKLVETLLQEADIHLAADDAVKCGECIQRVIEIQREEGGKRLTAQALGYLLPGSKYYPLLATLPPPEPAGRHSSTFDVEMAIHMHPLRTISEVITLHEELEQKAVDQEVERKRMRIDGAGKSKDTLRNEAGVAVWQQSPLPGLYESVMNHGEASDDERRDAEGKLLRFLHRLLLALPSSSAASTGPKGTAAVAETTPAQSPQSATRDEICSRIVEMTRGMVIVGVPDELAWAIHLEWQDVSRLTAYSRQTLRKFISLFPRSGRASAFRALLLSVRDEQYLIEVDEAKKASDVDYGDADDLEPLDHAVRGVDLTPQSTLCQWMAARLYLLERDFVSANETASTATRRVEGIQADTGASLAGPLRELQSIQGVSIARSGAGTTQHRSKAIRHLDGALVASSDGLDVEATMARGFLDCETGKWKEAQRLYQSVVDAYRQEDGDASTLSDEARLCLHKQPGVEARAELAWCTVMLGELTKGKEQLTDVATVLDADGSKDEKQQLFQDQDRARTWWRLGECSLRQGDARSAFDSYITALKRHPSFAPAFTSLGTYYESHANPTDAARSSKCFQKAFELDSREFHAAFKLADHYASDREWDLVSLIAKRVIEGEGGAQALGKDAGALAAQQRYKPQNAWAWKASGSVRLEKGDFEGAISPLQIALRTTPDDATIWQRLGEAYSKTGRFAAALKAFARATELDPDGWQTLYYVAEVRRALGQYDEAIELLDSILERLAHDMTASTLGVRVALGETYLTKSAEEFSTGYVVRAERSLERALRCALAVITADHRLRSSWKIVTDALFTLGQFGSLSAYDVISREVIAPLLDLIDRHYPSIDADLPAIDVINRGVVNQTSASSSSSSSSSSLPATSLLAACAYVSKLRVILCAADTHTLPSAWADLSASLARYGQLLPGGEAPATLTKQSISCIKAALNQEPANATFWMVLGNLTFSSSVQIAQHAFVRAIESNVSSNVQDASPWTSLGLLYLHHGDLELANDAFVQARTIDPDHAAAWAGQALLAAQQGHSTDARRTFENAIELSQGSLLEADYGFARGVFASASSSPASSSTALTALKSYLSQRPADATVLHLCALFCERLQMYPQARAHLESAKTLLEEEYDRTESPQVATQFGVVMCDLGRLQESEATRRDGGETAAAQLQEAVQNLESGLGLLEESGEDVGDDGEDGASTAAPALSPADRVKAQVGAHCALCRIRHHDGDAQHALQALDEADAVIKSSSSSSSSSSSGASSVLPPVKQREFSSDVATLRARILYSSADTAQAKEVLLSSIGSSDGDAGDGDDDDGSKKDVQSILTLLAMSIVDEDQELLEEVVGELDGVSSPAVEDLKASRKFWKGKDDDGLAVLRAASGRGVHMHLHYLNALVRTLCARLGALAEGDEAAHALLTTGREAVRVAVDAVHGSVDVSELDNAQVAQIWQLAAVVEALQRRFRGEEMPALGGNAEMLASQAVRADPSSAAAWTTLALAKKASVA